ncbi:MAG: hypothetical protein US69_C0006G0004 [candidate division TM6 bacterium GW2011_GWF2_38_10]|nr:MAG: hypothetical protein US69_C0006G0004 [candidate division TM6 bacterium GW2011_GWF2_38_10]
MKNKVYLQAILLIFSINFCCQSQIITRKSLEDIKTRALVINVVSSLMMYFGHNLPPEIIKLSEKISPIMHYNTDFVEDVIIRVLEDDGGMNNLIAVFFNNFPVSESNKPCITSILKLILNEENLRALPKLIKIMLESRGLRPALVLMSKTMCTTKTIELINYMYPQEAEHFKRQVFRTLALTMIEGCFDMFQDWDDIFENQKLVDQANDFSLRNKSGIFLSYLIYNIILEYIALSIIRRVNLDNQLTDGMIGTGQEDAAVA